MEKSLFIFLSSHPIFSNLSQQEIESLDRHVSQEKVTSASYIFLEEEQAQHFYILKEGMLRAVIGGKILASIKPGELFGEIAVLNNSFRSGSVFAVEDSMIIKVNGTGAF